MTSRPPSHGPQPDQRPDKIIEGNPPPPTQTPTQPTPIRTPGEPDVRIIPADAPGTPPSVTTHLAEKALENAMPDPNYPLIPRATRRGSVPDPNYPPTPRIDYTHTVPDDLFVSSAANPDSASASENDRTSENISDLLSADPSFPPRPDLTPDGSPPPSSNIKMVPDVYEQLWLGARTMLAIMFYEHDSPTPTSPTKDWNSQDEATKARYFKMAQDTMSNGTHDVVYGESVRRRSNQVRMAEIAKTVLVSREPTPALRSALEKAGRSMDADRVDDSNSPDHPHRYRPLSDS